MVKALGDLENLFQPVGLFPHNCSAGFNFNFINNRQEKRGLMRALVVGYHMTTHRDAVIFAPNLALATGTTRPSGVSEF